MTKTHLTGVAIAALMAASLGACTKPDAGANGAAKPAADTGKIADAVKADVAQLVTDFNSHDATKASSHDAPDVVAMSHGQANVVGAADDLAGAKKMFAANSTPHVTLANETVDVANSGEMAVYRSTYVFTVTDSKTKKMVTENGNYLAGYKQQPDGTWKIAWSVISDTPATPAAAMPAAAPAPKS